MEDGREMCERKWIFREGSPEGEADDITVMTYNILIDSHCREGGYSYCPDTIRYMNSRGPHIIAEVQHFSADVVCLQEVTESQYLSMLRPALEKIGYAGVHMSHPYRGGGLAMFHKGQTLSLEETRQFQTPDLVGDYTKETDLDKSDIDDLSNEAKTSGGLLVGRFRQISSGKVVTVGNTHVRWTFFHLPVLQSLEVALSHRVLKKMAGGSSYIFCGDFNSTPTFEPYQLLANGVLHTGEKRLWNPAEDVRLFKLKTKGDGSDGYDFDEEAVEVSSIKPVEDYPRERLDFPVEALKSLLPFSKAALLNSTYLTVMGMEPEVTNYDADSWTGHMSELCLDYIWYSAGVQTTRVLEPPTRESMRKRGALPNYLHPSDHIPLVAGFRLK